MLKTIRLGIQPRILMMFLLLSAIPLLVGTWIFFSHSEATFLELKSQELAEMAEISVLQLNNHLNDLSALVDTLSFTEAVRAVVNESNSRAGKVELETEAREIEKAWSQLPPDDTRVEKIIKSDLSDYLRKFINRYDDVIEEIIILDSVGTVVVATVKPVQYYHGGKDWYAIVEERYLKQHQGTFSDIHYERTVKGAMFKTEIAVPIFDAERNEFTGMIKCIIQIKDINKIIRPFKFQKTGQAIVMSEDGTIISSRQYDLSDQVTYEYFEKVKAVLNDKDYPKSYAIIEEEGEAVRLVGLPETDLMSFFPELKWYIFTDQEIRDALGPVYGLKGTALVYVSITILLIIFLAFWFSRILTKPTIETDIHLGEI